MGNCALAHSAWDAVVDEVMLGAGIIRSASQPHLNHWLGEANRIAICEYRRISDINDCIGRHKRSSS